MKPVKLADNSKAMIIINPSISNKTKGILKECDIEKIIEDIEDERFFDSNIFLSHLSGNYPEATYYIELVESGAIQGYISDIVYLEVILGYLRAQSHLNTHELRGKIFYLYINSEDLSQYFSLFINISTYIGNEIFEMSDLYHLLPHDTLISAVCIKLVKKSKNNKYFKRVPFMKNMNKVIKNQKEL